MISIYDMKPNDLAFDKNEMVFIFTSIINIFRFISDSSKCYSKYCLKILTAVFNYDIDFLMSIFILQVASLVGTIK